MNIKELRKSNNKTQIDIANMLGMSQNTYSKYELGLTEPNITNLIKLADYYNVSIDYLVGRQWNNDIGYLTPQVRELVKLGQQLNEQNLIKALGYLTAMVTMQ